MLYFFDSIEGNSVKERNFTAHLEDFTAEQQQKLLNGEEIPDTLHGYGFCALSDEE